MKGQLCRNSKNKQLIEIIEYKNVAAGQLRPYIGIPTYVISRGAVVRQPKCINTIRMARHSPTVLSESPVKADISMLAIVLTLR